MMKFSTITFAAFLSLPTLLGCHQTTAPLEPHTRQTMSLEQQDIPHHPAGFRIKVLIEPQTIVEGSAPDVHLEISNYSPKSVSVGGLFSCVDYGFVARDKKGNVITDSWSGVDCVANAQSSWVILPGEAFTVEAPSRWNLSYLPPGSYWIEGKILSSSRPVTPRVLLTVLASGENGTKRQPSRTR